MNFYIPKKGILVDNLTVNKALKFLNIAEIDYYDVLSLSPISIMLKVWRDNVDLQPVFNYYKPVSYMSACFSKSESETS